MMAWRLRGYSLRSHLGNGVWYLGVAFLGVLALGSRGESPKTPPVAAAKERAADAQSIPPELESLNSAGRQMYAAARARELAAIPIVIVVSGDDLVLRRNGNRTVARVLGREYHALKCVAHPTLALFTHLASSAGRPLDHAQLKLLREYQSLLTAAIPAVEKLGFDAEVLALQKRLLTRAVEFAASVIRDGKVTDEDLKKYCRSSRTDILANGALAARSQVAAMHQQVMTWKKGMSAEEWAGLTVVISGSPTPRADNLAVQYFSRLLGEPHGECRRIVYAESLWDEEKAVNLLGTLRLDGKLSIAVFGDPVRMYRDFLADGARTAIDDLFAAP